MCTAAISRSDFQIRRQFFKSLGHQRGFDWLNPAHARGGLHRQRGNTRHAVTTVGSDSLDISGNAGAGARIETGNG